MLKILVVDDAATDRIRVAGIASKWKSCEVLQAENGRDAIHQVATCLPDIVLTDLNMPEMDGLQLVTSVRSDYPQIPIILMTGDGSENLAAEALKKGAASYVPKNRLAEDLHETLDLVYNTSQSAHTLSRLMHYMTETQTQFVLPNDPSLLKICLDRLISMLRCLPLGDETERVRVGIALREAISNAYFHGNLEVEDDEIDESTMLNMDAWKRIASSRWYEAPYSDRRVHISADINRQRAIFVIGDDGDGFDVPGQLGGEPEIDTTSVRGRGLALMRSIMDEVSFNEYGNEIRLVRYAVRNDDAVD